MATIHDVARLAGVSAKTVSRVLNGNGPVGGQTRAQVDAAIAELGFVPSSAARMMRSQRSGLIGLITGAISVSDQAARDSGLPELHIVQGIQRELAQSPFTLMIADTGGRMDQAPRLIETFLRHRVEGLIHVAEYHQEVSLPLTPDHSPLVLVNCYDRIGTPAILPDDRRGQHDLVARLIAAGHRRIAYLTLFDWLDATRLRHQGYRDALAEAGLPEDPALVVPCERTDPEAETRQLQTTIGQLLALPDPPTVFCCGNDKMAIKVYGILRSRGLRLPQDVSVAGYDNHRVIAETLYPPLTTVELPYVAMGARAAQRLLGLISGEGRKDDGPQIIDGPVHWRMSVSERRTAHLQLVRED